MSRITRGNFVIVVIFLWHVSGFVLASRWPGTAKALVTDLAKKVRCRATKTWQRWRNFYVNPGGTTRSLSPSKKYFNQEAALLVLQVLVDGDRFLWSLRRSPEIHPRAYGIVSMQIYTVCRFRYSMPHLPLIDTRGTLLSFHEDSLEFSRRAGNKMIQKDSSHESHKSQIFYATR